MEQISRKKINVKQNQYGCIFVSVELWYCNNAERKGYYTQIMPVSKVEEIGGVTSEYFCPIGQRRCFDWVLAKECSRKSERNKECAEKASEKIAQEYLQKYGLEAA